MSLLRTMFLENWPTLRRPAASEAPVEEPRPLLRTSGLFDQQISDYWAGLSGASGASTQTLLDKVWVANHCLQMSANAISTMPLRFYGSRSPAWVSSPDPVWYPNGIADATFAIIHSYYGWGDAFLLVTSRYADGYPSGWTVLDPSTMAVESKGGRRRYRSGQTWLDERDVVQISRDPRPGSLRGTSVIASLSPYTNGLLAAADLGRVMMGSGATPNAVLKSTKHRLSKEQAALLQSDWMTATAVRQGAPAVLPPDIEFEKLSFSPADLMLLDAQKFDAQVIAAGFGVPAVLVNMSIEGGLNYQTPVLALEQWWRTELRTTAYRVEKALSSNMLPAGSYVEFDPYKFLAPSWKELVDGWTAIVEKGLASVEEFRTIVLGLSPQTTPEDALDELATPPSAGASPAQRPSADVVSLRPTVSASNGSY